jgi:hypothetical protein
MRIRVLATILSIGIMAEPANAHDAATDAIVVRTPAELLAAVSSGTGEHEIHVARGRYSIDQPIVVPDGVAITGDGVMRFDDDGTPSGFEPGTETILETAAGVNGDLLTLGNGATLRGLVLIDDPHQAKERTGNVVSVVSRRPNDVVAASIIECEIVSLNAKAFSVDGPTGRGVVAYTRNPMAQPRRPHDGAMVNVRVERSIVRDADDGGAVFVLNFASGAQAGATLIRNRVVGTLIAGGAANRPTTVDHATTVIEAEHNLFVSPRGDNLSKGWLLVAASSGPHLPSEAAGPSFNTLRVRSTADRIEGFASAIIAIAARLIASGSGPLFGNTLDLQLNDLRIHSVGADAADLELHAALALLDQNQPPLPGLDAGERNTLRIRMTGSVGSGHRKNTYASCDDAADTASANRLELAGSAGEYARANSSFDPAPPTACFRGRLDP